MYYIVNLGQDQSKSNRYLSNTLLQKIEKTIKDGKKTILYLNRRGEYSSLFCTDCNHLFKCDNCDISMSVHKYPEKLVCHLCGNQKNIPIKCEKCGGVSLQKAGVGTEQIETSLKKIFPQVLIHRFDTDNIKIKKDKEDAIKNMSEAQIVIGTKMITTGFDFPDVALIGVILLEQELLIPKYNIEEITYTNIKQLIGRGGRSGENKEIVIQTFISENELIKSITEDNYKDFFKKTLLERKMFGYPPFKDFAILEFRDKNEEKSLNFCKNLKNKLDLLNTSKKIDIVFVEKSFRKNNSYHHKIVLKGENLAVFLENIRYEIIRNSNLSLTFDYCSSF